MKEILIWVALFAFSFSTGFVAGCVEAPKKLRQPYVSEVESTSNGAADQSPEEQSALALQVLETYCANCHGANGTQSGGLDGITDFNHLVAAGYVVQGDPDNSKIIKRMRSTTQKMPPVNMPQPTSDELELVANLIRDGDRSIKQPPPPKPIVTVETEFNFVLRDLDVVAEESANDARFTRYLSLTHLQNLGTSDETMATWMNSVSRFLNSVSTNQAIVKPSQMDDDVPILRFDLRDFDLTQNDWELLVNRYPYEDLNQSNARARSFQDRSGSRLPVLRADWFVRESSQPEFYQRFVNIPQSADQLANNLGFNANDNIRQTALGQGAESNAVQRSGFLNSGVALNNRVIERHNSDFGAYWQSYDFKAPRNANEASRKDVFASPFGPRSAINSAASFEQDGGEIIFSLPNGLHGFMVVNQNNQRIDAVPTDVAFDPKHPEAIINGYSCMTCHAGGFINQTDEILSAVETGGGFDVNQREAAGFLYPSASVFAQFIADDNLSYLAALRRASLTDDATVDIVVLATNYDRDVPLAVVAAEFGLTSAEFESAVDNSENSLRRSLASLLSTSSINRETLEGLIPEMVRSFFGN